MRDTEYELKVKSAGSTEHWKRWSDAAARLVSFTIVVLKDGRPLGGHNIQAHVGSATDREPADVDLWLGSGWWVTFRNQFAQAPGVATKIIESADEELSTVTSELEHARGPAMAEAAKRLWAMSFHARGPDYWK